MRIITTTAVVLFVALGCAHSQAQQTDQQPALQKMQPSNIELTGCLIQGSSAAVFLLDKAKKDPKDANEEPVRYFISPTAAPDIDLKAHLKHSVRITATEDFKVSAMPVRVPKSPSSERPGEERTLPRLIIKSVTMVSDKCPAGN
jgi:hypothetical protein